MSLLRGLSHSARKLMDAAYAKDTKDRYSRAVTEFLDWSGLDLPTRDSALDRRLANFFGYLYSHYNGRRRQTAVNALHGLIRNLPHLKPTHKLPYSRRCLRAWLKKCPPKTKPPMSRELMFTFSAQMASHGWFESMVLLLLMYDGWLRIGEALHLKVKHYQRVGVFFKDTKTGHNQSVDLRSESTVFFLDLLVDVFDLSRNDYIFSISAPQFNAHLKQVCAECKVPKYTSHTARHGAATEDFSLGIPVPNIMVRGRWKSLKSCKTYLQTARALQIRRHLPHQILTIGQAIGDHTTLLLSSYFLDSFNR
jgi:integrase